MKNLKSVEMLPFIPSGKNYKVAIQFYKEIGFEVDWTSEDISIIRKDNCRFFLYNNPNHWMQDNFMMTLDVENLDDWWEHLSELNLEVTYAGVKLKAPEDYSWGKREIHLIDPCGVLWHIAVNL
jgi:uncharacterized glyoxalase superfamily protein PhnB